MPRCCGSSGACGCKVSAGTGITVSGTGSASDPIVVSSSSGLTVADTTTFDLSLAGGPPPVLSVNFAASAKLKDFPDVSDTTPTNGQVLGYNTGSGTWGPIPPTTAAAGSVSHDASLSGDGSGGTPLQVNEDPSRLLATVAGGLGLSDVGMNSVLRRYSDATARASASPAPTLNSLSALDSRPGEVDYWNGAAWLRIQSDTQSVLIGPEFMSMSGSYLTGMGVIRVMKQINGSTDINGLLPLFTAAELTGFAGVLSVQVTPTGANPWIPVVQASVDHVDVVSYRVTDGSLNAGNVIQGSAVATCY